MYAGEDTIPDSLGSKSTTEPSERKTARRAQLHALAEKARLMREQARVVREQAHEMREDARRMCARMRHLWD
jgi:uncharacterized coiled-coil DUF342 family protein